MSSIDQAALGMPTQEKRLQRRLVIIGMVLASFWGMLPAVAYITGFKEQTWVDVVGNCDIKGQRWRETVGNIGTNLTAEVGNTCYRLDVHYNFYHEDLGWRDNPVNGTGNQPEKRYTMEGVLALGTTKHRGCLSIGGGLVDCSTWKTMN